MSGILLWAASSLGAASSLAILFFWGRIELAYWLSERHPFPLNVPHAFIDDEVGWVSAYYRFPEWVPLKRAMVWRDRILIPTGPKRFQQRSSIEFGGILSHEIQHVRDGLRLVLYLCSRKYRMWFESRGFAAQCFYVARKQTSGQDYRFRQNLETQISLKAHALERGYYLGASYEECSRRIRESTEKMIPDWVP